MKIIGIIAEYNPFHNGHIRHLRQSAAQIDADGVVCVMSGNFTQRGDAAILDKWSRAGAAVENGVDLVLELPVAFSVRSAQNFALGGAALLSALGVVTHLSFGAETDDLRLLAEAARQSADPAVKERLRRHLLQGQSYAAALTAAVGAAAPAAAALMRSPNNILAIEYLKALAHLRSPLRPVLIRRGGAQYHDDRLCGAIASATAIRREAADSSPSLKALQSALPAASFQSIAALCGHEERRPNIAYLGNALLAKLRLMKTKEIAQIAGISEGLENKLAAASLQCATFDELAAAIASKRYPNSRIRRLLFHCLMGTGKNELAAFDADGPLYARVLSFNCRGRLLLKEIKRKSQIPLLIKTADALSSAQRSGAELTPVQKMLAADTYATDLYSLCFAKSRPGAQDFTTSPVYKPGAK